MEIGAETVLVEEQLTLADDGVSTVHLAATIYITIPNKEQEEEEEV